MQIKFFLLLILSIGINSSIYSKTIKGSGNIIQQVRNISNFNEISVICPCKIELKQDNNESVLIEADDNIISNIQTRIINNELRINLESNITCQDCSIKLIITLKNIAAIELSGSIELVTLPIKTKKLLIKTSGSSKVNSNLFAKELNISSSGSSNLHLYGEAEIQNLIFSGAVKYSADNFHTKKTSICSSGSSKVQIDASDEINGSISGSSNLKYKGEPKINISTSGSSKIQKLN